jgi:hypothetical protein
MRLQYAVRIAFLLGTCAIGSTMVGPSSAAEADATVDDTKQNAPRPTATAAAVAACEAAWTAADLNKNGVLDPDEALVYAAALNVEHKPPVTDTNLNRAGFLRDC